MNSFTESKPINPQCTHCNDTGTISQRYQRGKRERSRLVACPSCGGKRKDGTTQSRAGVAPIETNQKNQAEGAPARTPDILPQDGQTDMVQPLTGQPPEEEPWPGFSQGAEPTPPERPTAQGQTANPPKADAADTQSSGSSVPPQEPRSADTSAAQDSALPSDAEPAPETDRGPLPDLA